jgi:hypothetical protein
MIMDPINALHQMYQGSYTGQHLDFLAYLYDQAIRHPELLQRTCAAAARAYADLEGDRNAQDRWIKDVYTCLDHVLSISNLRPSAAIKSIAAPICAQLSLHIVQVQGALPEWTAADQYKLHRLYMQWTSMLPRVHYIQKTDCLAGFIITTHALHDKRILCNASLAGRLQRFTLNAQRLLQHNNGLTYN